MNEELLQLIYDNEGFEDRGVSFDKFKTDMSNPELQSLIFEKAGFEDRGISFDKFQQDLGMSQPQPTQIAEPKKELTAKERMRALVNQGSETEVEGEKDINNPLKSFGKSFYNSAVSLPSQVIDGIDILSNQGAMGIIKGAKVLADVIGAEDTSEFLEESIGRGETMKQVTLDRMLESANKRSEANEGLTKSIRDVFDDDPLIDNIIDGVNLVAGFAGDALPTIAASVLSYGTTGFAQMTTEGYTSAVMAKAEVLGITPEEVIDQGLDQDALIISMAAAGAALEFLGAKGVAKQAMSNLSKKSFTNEIRKRGKGFLKSPVNIEGVTEAAQNLLTSISTAAESGQELDENYFRELGIDSVDAYIGGASGAAGANVITSQLGKLNQKLFKQGTTAQAVSEAAPNLSQKDQDKIIDLQTELETLEDNDTEAGKLRKAELKNEIKSIQFPEEDTTKQTEKSDAVVKDKPKKKTDTKTKIPDLTDDQYNTFVDTGDASQDIVDGIAAKIADDAPLTDRERAVQQAKGVNIEEALQAVKDRDVASDDLSTPVVEPIETSEAGLKVQFKKFFSSRAKGKEKSGIKSEQDVENNASFAATILRAVAETRAKQLGITPEEYISNTFSGGIGKMKTSDIDEAQSKKQSDDDIITFTKPLNGELYSKSKESEFEQVPVKLGDIGVEQTSSPDDGGRSTYTIKAKDQELGTIEVLEDGDTVRIDLSNLLGTVYGKGDNVINLANTLAKAAKHTKLKLDKLGNTLTTVTADTWVTGNLNSGKGIGKKAYIDLGNKLALEGVTLQSDREGSRSDAANAMWNNLVKDGKAELIDDTYNTPDGVKKTNRYQFIPDDGGINNIQDAVEYLDRRIPELEKQGANKSRIARLKEYRNALDKDSKFQNDNSINRGAVVTLANMDLLITSLEQPNAFTAIHEFFHGFMKDATPAEKQLFVDEYNKSFKPTDKRELAKSFKNRDVEEFGARMFEKYIGNGRVVDGRLNAEKKARFQQIFDAFSEWMGDVYNRIITYTNKKGQTAEVKVSREVKDLFDNLLNIKTNVKIKNDQKPKRSNNDQRVRETQEEDDGQISEDEIVNDGDRVRSPTQKTINNADAPTQSDEEFLKNLDEVYHSDKSINREINSTIKSMGSAGFTNIESLSFSNALKEAAKAGRISPDGSKERQIAHDVLDGAGVDEFDEIALQFALANTQRKLVEYIGEAQSLPDVNAELSQKILSTRQDLDIFNLALHRSGQIGGRVLRMRQVLLNDLNSLGSMISKIESSSIPVNQKKALRDLANKIDQNSKDIQQKVSDSTDTIRSKAKSETGKFIKENKKSSKRANKDARTNFKDKFSKKNDKKGKGDVKFSQDGYDNGSSSIVEYAKYLIKRDLKLTDLNKLAIGKSIDIGKDDFKKVESNKFIDSEGSEFSTKQLANKIKNYNKKIETIEGVVDEILQTYNQLPNKNPNFIVTRDDILLSMSNGINQNILKSRERLTKDLIELRKINLQLTKLKNSVEGVVTQAKAKKIIDYSKPLSDLKAAVKAINSVYTNKDKLFSMSEDEKGRVAEMTAEISRLYSAIFMNDGAGITDDQVKQLMSIANNLNHDKKIDRLTKKRDSLLDGSYTPPKQRTKKRVEDDDIAQLIDQNIELRGEFMDKLRRAEVYYSILVEEIKAVDPDNPTEAEIKKANWVWDKKILFNFRNWFEGFRTYKLGLDFSFGFMQGGPMIFKTLAENTAGRGVDIVTGRDRFTTRGSLNYEGLKDALHKAVSIGLKAGSDRNLDAAVDDYKSLMTLSSNRLGKAMGVKMEKPGHSNDDMFKGRTAADFISDTPVLKFMKVIASTFENFSEASYTVFINRLAATQWNTFLKVNENASVEEMKEYAKVINNNVGRSNLKVTGPMSDIILAPRFYTSRIHMLAEPFKVLGRGIKKKGKLNLADKERLRDLTSTVTGYTALIALMAMGGWDYEEDPRAKGFAKFKKGDETIDFTAGMGKWADVAVKSLAFTDSISGVEAFSKLFGERLKSEEFNKFTDAPLTLGLRKIGTSLNVPFLWLNSLMTNENVIGQNLGVEWYQRLPNTIVAAISPIVFQDFITDAINQPLDEKYPSPFWAKEYSNTLSILGIGHIDYENNLKHIHVIKHLDKLEISPDRSIDRSVVTKRIPEVDKASFRNEAIIDNAKAEIKHAVGSRILADLNKGKNPSKEVIAKYTKDEATRILRIYSKHYGLKFNSSGKAKKK
jgi:hypothetical protein